MGRLFRALPMIKTQQAAIYKQRLAVRDINADTGKMNMVSCLTTNCNWPTDALKSKNWER